MYKRFNYRLYPTTGQEILLAKSFGCNRLIWNKFLELENLTYKNTKKFLFYNNKASQLVDLKQQKEFEFLNEVNSQTFQQTLKHQDTAFKNFFRDKKHFHYPTFKSKKNKQSITIPQHIEISYESGYTKICKIGNIPTIFHRKIDGKIKSCTITKTSANNYYISFCCEIEKPLALEVPKANEANSLAIDVGLTDFLVASDGTTISNPKFFKQSQNKLAHHQRSFNRKVKGSSNREQQRVEVAKVHEQISNQRKDFFYNLVKHMVNNNQINHVFTEDLNIKGMIQNHKLAKAIQDTGWGMFLGILGYKLSWNNKNLSKIERFFASSKTCNNCAYVNKDLKLSDRIWICPNCGQKLYRDLNAARNIKEFGLYGVITPKSLVHNTPLRKATSGEAKERFMELMTSTSVGNDRSKSQQRSELTQCIS